jgi:hypothetical protein
LSNERQSTRRSILAVPPILAVIAIAAITAMYTINTIAPVSAIATVSTISAILSVQGSRYLGDRRPYIFAQFSDDLFAVDALTIDTVATILAVLATLQWRHRLNDAKHGYVNELRRALGKRLLHACQLGDTRLKQADHGWDQIVQPDAGAISAIFTVNWPDALHEGFVVDEVVNRDANTIRWPLPCRQHRSCHFVGNLTGDNIQFGQTFGETVFNFGDRCQPLVQFNYFKVPFGKRNAVFSAPQVGITLGVTLYASNSASNAICGSGKKILKNALILVH